MPRKAPDLSIGVFPTGISYADRSREKHGDYARCAFLDFATLNLKVERDCPSSLRKEIEADAAKIQARRGEQYPVSWSGQTVLLGDARHLREESRMPRKPIADMIAELQSWLPNYDHGPGTYPDLVWRMLASMHGGDEAADMGFEPLLKGGLGWQEVQQLGDMLTVLESPRDVEDLVRGLMGDDEEDEEPRREAGALDRNKIQRALAYVHHWERSSTNKKGKSREVAAREAIIGEGLNDQEKDILLNALHITRDPMRHAGVQTPRRRR